MFLLVPDAISAPDNVRALEIPRDWCLRAVRGCFGLVPDIIVYNCVVNIKQSILFKDLCGFRSGGSSSSFPPGGSDELSRDEGVMVEIEVVLV